MLLRHTSDINMPIVENFPPVKEVAKQSEFHLFPPSMEASDKIKIQLEQQPITNPTLTVDYLC